MTIGKRVLELAERAAKEAIAADRKRTAAELRKIHSALVCGLGDSDVTYMNDDELRESYPFQWAACKLSDVIEGLEE